MKIEIRQSKSPFADGAVKKPSVRCNAVTLVLDENVVQFSFRPGIAAETASICMHHTTSVITIWGENLGFRYIKTGDETRWYQYKWEIGNDLGTNSSYCQLFSRRDHLRMTVVHSEDKFKICDDNLEEARWGTGETESLQFNHCESRLITGWGWSVCFKFSVNNFVSSVIKVARADTLDLKEK